MSANVYLKSLTLATDAWSRLADARTIVDSTLIFPSTNAADVKLRWNGGSSVSFPNGTTFPLKGVDLFKIEAQALTANDKILVAGNSR